MTCLPDTRSGICGPKHFGYVKKSPPKCFSFGLDAINILFGKAAILDKDDVYQTKMFHILVLSWVEVFVQGWISCRWLLS